jgi:hypothetical protein
MILFARGRRASTQRYLAGGAVPLSPACGATVPRQRATGGRLLGSLAFGAAVLRDARGMFLGIAGGPSRAAMGWTSS